MTNKEYIDLNHNMGAKKPPIGIIPEYFWKVQRFNDLCGVISRYLNEGYKIHVEWVEEYNQFIDEKKLEGDSL